MRMMKLQPEDTVALYYKNLVQSAIQNGEEVFISYNYQVPPSETHRRITYLYECFRQNTQQLEKLWMEDDYFSSMLIWGMNMGNAVIKKAIFKSSASSTMKKRWIFSSGFYFPGLSRTR